MAPSLIGAFKLDPNLKSKSVHSALYILANW